MPLDEHRDGWLRCPVRATARATRARALSGRVRSPRPPSIILAAAHLQTQQRTRRSQVHPAASHTRTQHRTDASVHAARLAGDRSAAGEVASHQRAASSVRPAAGPIFARLRGPSGLRRRPPRRTAAFAAERQARSAAGQLARGARRGSAPLSLAHAEQLVESLGRIGLRARAHAPVVQREVA